MRTWSLRAGDPISLRLAADVRGGGTNPFCDVVWDLTLRGGDPPALALSSISLPFQGALEDIAIRLLDAGRELRFGESPPANSEELVRDSTEMVAVSCWGEHDYNAFRWEVGPDQLNRRLQVSVGRDYDCDVVPVGIGIPEQLHGKANI